eukprot:288799-Chlamydomonas_euryale.AAC.1
MLVAASAGHAPPPRPARRQHRTPPHARRCLQYCLPLSPRGSMIWVLRRRRDVGRGKIAGCEPHAWLGIVSLRLAGAWAHPASMRCCDSPPPRACGGSDGRCRAHPASQCVGGSRSSDAVTAAAAAAAAGKRCVVRAHVLPPPLPPPRPPPAPRPPPTTREGAAAGGVRVSVDERTVLRLRALAPPPAAT